MVQWIAGTSDLDRSAAQAGRRAQRLKVESGGAEYGWRRAQGCRELLFVARQVAQGIGQCMLIAPICVSARFAALPELLAPLNPAANRTDTKMDARVWLRAQIAVEELFANSIHHGYGRECDDPVWLSVACSDDSLHVTYADAAMAFDPLSGLKPLSEISMTPLEERHIGGLGRLMVKELAHRCEYRRDNGCNVVLMDFTDSGHTLTE
jgi:anti-sigma regulatory factor (Ser/Thr protein kinase)